MAWRIDEAVVRGEIDNRGRGQVVGRIWFVNREQPVELKLEGNAWRDVAGRLLRFENPAPKAMDLTVLRPLQFGVVGDITASRKVKVPAIPMDQIGEYYAAKKPWPWHWGNSLYLEWFSLANGRVVIETAAFQLTVEDEVVWEMSAEEEVAQRAANTEALTGFMERIAQAFAAESTEATADAPADEPYDPPPQTEAEAEAEQARQDLLLDRIQARMEKEGPEADFECIMDEERERLRRERSEPEPPADWEPGQPDWDALIDEAEATEPDPEIITEERFEHPLGRRAADLFHRLHEHSDSEQWLPENPQAEYPVLEVINSTTWIGPKLAGALNGGRWPPELQNCASTIVRLKRAHGYIDDALNAAESGQEDSLIAPIHLGPAVVDLTDIAQEIRRLIAELRERLDREDTAGS